MALQGPLDCIEVHPEHVFRSVYNSPFESSPDFTEGWWSDVPYSYGSTGGIEFLSFRSAGVEVARAQILLNKVPGSDYRVPRLASEYMELSFFEVAARYQRQGLGIGTRAVQSVIDRYPNVGLLAYSEEADEFWDTLGWRKFDHPRGMPSYRPLYVWFPQNLR